MPTEEQVAAEQAKVQIPVLADAKPGEVTDQYSGEPRPVELDLGNGRHVPVNVAVDGRPDTGDRYPGVLYVTPDELKDLTAKVARVGTLKDAIAIAKQNLEIVTFVESRIRE